MTKKDLKDGMIIECRNSLRYIVLCDNFVRECGYNRLSQYKEDLTYDSDEFDIVKIYEPIGPYQLKDIFEDRNLKLIWSRNSFSKKDLKNGAVVTTKEGKNYIKIDNTLINLKTGGYLDLDDYTDDLKNKCAVYDEFDILSVDNVGDYDKHCYGPYNHYINK